MPRSIRLTPRPTHIIARNRRAAKWFARILTGLLFMLGGLTASFFWLIYLLWSGRLNP